MYDKEVLQLTTLGRIYMKKTACSISMLLLLFSFICIPATSFSKDLTLKYANFFPPTHVQSILAESWSKEVEKRTQGRVKVQYYPGGSLLKGKQMYDGVVDGIADIGFSVLAYTRGTLPCHRRTGTCPGGIHQVLWPHKLLMTFITALKPVEFNDTPAYVSPCPWTRFHSHP